VTVDVDRVERLYDVHSCLRLLADSRRRVLQPTIIVLDFDFVILS
jgi:hypothetical protein